MRTQFNVRIKPSVKRRAAIDKTNTNATFDVITEVALTDFFSRYTAEERARFYRNHDFRPYGRSK